MSARIALRGMTLISSAISRQGFVSKGVKPLLAQQLPATTVLSRQQSTDPPGRNFPNDPSLPNDPDVPNMGDFQSNKHILPDDFEVIIPDIDEIPYELRPLEEIMDFTKEPVAPHYEEHEREEAERSWDAFIADCMIPETPEELAKIEKFDKEQKVELERLIKEGEKEERKMDASARFVDVITSHPDWNGDEVPEHHSSMKSRHPMIRFYNFLKDCQVGHNGLETFESLAKKDANPWYTRGTKDILVSRLVEIHQLPEDAWLNCDTHEEKEDYLENTILKPIYGVTETDILKWNGEPNRWFQDNLWRPMPEPLYTSEEQKFLRNFSPTHWDHPDVLAQPTKKGTKENPIMVPSINEDRIIGCSCEEDSHSVEFFRIKTGEMGRCLCGNTFKVYPVPVEITGSDH